MKLKKLTSIALAAALGLSLFTGCSSKEPASAEDPNELIQIAVSADLTSLDPHLNNDTTSGYATRHVYNTLIRLDEDDNNTYKSDLAESWEMVDPTTYTFKLFEGIKFHDGSVLTAEDVKFSLDRQKKSAKVGHLVSIIDEVTVQDDLNLTITLTGETNTLLSSLSHMGSSIISKAYTEALEADGKTLADNPMGTGPYCYEEWVPGASFTLVKFDDYFDQTRAAQNGGLKFIVIPEETARTIALETGEVDMMMNVPATDANRIRESEELELEEFDATRLEYLVLNLEKAPFDNVQVRRALNYAVNKDDVLTAMTSGEGKTCDGYFSSAAIGYQDVDTVYSYNPEEAKAILAEAGFPDGFTFTCLVAGDTRSRGATVIQANLADVGITMEIEMMESAAFYETTGQGNFEAGISGWSADAEPDHTYRPLFTTEYFGEGGNRSFYSNPEVDELVNLASITTDPAVIKETQETILNILVDDAIWVPLNTWSGMVARAAGLQGLGISHVGMERFEGLHYEA